MPLLPKFSDRSNLQLRRFLDNRRAEKSKQLPVLCHDMINYYFSIKVCAPLLTSLPCLLFSWRSPFTWIRFRTIHRMSSRRRCCSFSDWKFDIPVKVFERNQATNFEPPWICRLTFQGSGLGFVFPRGRWEHKTKIIRARIWNEMNKAMLSSYNFKCLLDNLRHSTSYPFFNPFIFRYVLDNLIHRSNPVKIVQILQIQMKN